MSQEATGRVKGSKAGEEEEPISGCCVVLGLPGASDSSICAAAPRQVFVGLPFRGQRDRENIYPLSPVSMGC